MGRRDTPESIVHVLIRDGFSPSRARYAVERYYMLAMQTARSRKAEVPEIALRKLVADEIVRRAGLARTP